MKMIITRGVLAILCVLFMVGGVVEAKESTSRKPQQENPTFEASEESSTLLFRVIDEDEVTITTTSAIYKIVLESEAEIPAETESPWIKKFWKEKIEQINKMLFSNRQSIERSK